MSFNGEEGAKRVKTRDVVALEGFKWPRHTLEVEGDQELRKANGL